MELSNSEIRFGLTSRQDLYENRLKTAKENLFSDMDNWIKFLPDGVIKHHIIQMNKLCGFVYDCLVTGNDDEGIVDEPVVFEALVIAVLTSQWMLWRQVILQRIPGLPYEIKLKQLDEFAAHRYFSMIRALPPETINKMSVHPPIVHLGAISALSLVEGGLSIVNVPFGVVFDNQIQYAISHELGHIFINNHPQILDELREILKEEFNGGTKREKVIRNKIMDWLEEIFADLIGTAMDGVDFANSGIWVMSSADTRTGITDKTHPESTIRPYIYDAVIEALEDSLFKLFRRNGMVENAEAEIKAEIKALKGKDKAEIKAILEKVKPGAAGAAAELLENPNSVAASENERLNKYYQSKLSFLGKLLDASGSENLENRLQSNESLFFPALEEVKEEMSAIVEVILKSKPETLQGDSVQDFLVRIVNNVNQPFAWYKGKYEQDVKTALDGVEIENFGSKFNWGEKSQQACDDFVLSLPARLNLEHGTPSLYDDIYFLCCRLNLGFCC